MNDEATSPRVVARLLSGYLCGTHSGVLGHRRRRAGPASAELVAAAFRALVLTETGTAECQLGGGRWVSEDRGVVSERMRNALTHPAVLELIVFGSQARDSTTGFSDVDAILVITDSAAGSTEALRRLRSRVLRAQRAVLAYQPMQHHAFEVVTPRLLGNASQALGLPSIALAETRSLYGTAVPASLSESIAAPKERLVALARQLLAIRFWPEHVWEVHRLISMFELLPVLYLQSRSRAVPKWRSFAEARMEFRDSWWPYDVLNEVRLIWPRRARRALEAAAVPARNPWAVVAVWRRLPARPPDSVRSLLRPTVLLGLRELAATIAERAA